VGFAVKLSDGRPKLRRNPVYPGKEDGLGSESHRRAATEESWP